MTKSSRWNGDVVSGAALAALGVFILNEARHWPYMTEEGPGPGFFPLWYGVAMIVLSLWLALSASLRTPKPAVTGGVNWKAVGRAMVVWLAFAVSVGLLQTIGFILSFALLTLFIVVGMYGKSWWLGIGLALVNAVSFHVIFRVALSVDLPPGPLGF